MDIYPEKPLTRKDTHTPVFIASLFATAKTCKQPKCPSIDEQMKKMWRIYTTKYYAAMEKGEIMPSAATWVDRETIVLGEVSQREKDTHQVILLLCGI